MRKIRRATIIFRAPATTSLHGSNFLSLVAFSFVSISDLLAAESAL
jgi:hypothetical protein